MGAHERVAFCRVVGLLLISDGVLTKDEARFLKNLMTRMGLSRAEQGTVRAHIREDSDLAGEVEVLRRKGHAEDLLKALKAAAMADGEFSASERAMISRIRRIIKYRLGDEGRGLALESLRRSPLRESYTFLGRLGEGGFSEVFKAFNKTTGEFCVIKRLKADIASDLPSKFRPTVEDRFWREVVLISNLRSQHTVRLLDAGFDVDTPYMILEYLEGESLEAALKRRALTSKEAQRLILQVLEAVAEAHDNGIVHRDLKPANIMFTDASLEVAKVLDFGISGIVDSFKDDRHFTITIPMQLLGTPAYMAPEQVQSIGTARRESDVYALGLILCECLQGRPVFRGEPYTLIREQVSERPAPISDELLAGPFGAVLHRGCQKLWYQRFGPPADMIARIRQVEAGAQRDELRVLEQELYRLYSPADEMAETIRQVDLDSPDGAAQTASSAFRPEAREKRKKFFSLIRRMLGGEQG